MRYRFYRVHKYVCYELAEFERAAAKTDFLDAEALQTLKEKLITLTHLLKHHGEFEDIYIHALLRQRNSTLPSAFEKEHERHDATMKELIFQLEHIASMQNTHEKLLAGNNFYLFYRLFYSEMLKHLYDEETVLLPELQALYSDEALAQVQAKTYQDMTSEDMLGMLNVLFPHANPEDMRFFVNEIKTAEPEKFESVWEQLDQHYKQRIMPLGAYPPKEEQSSDIFIRE